MGDCFDGLQTVLFRPAANSSEIPKVSNALVSKDGEIVPYVGDDFICDGAVEHWLARLE